MDAWNLNLYQGLTVCQSVKRQHHACYQHSGTLLTLKRLIISGCFHAGSRQFSMGALAIEDKHCSCSSLINKYGYSLRFNERFTGAFELIWKPEQQLPKKVGPDLKDAQYSG